jgi:hypothetical protein
MNVVRIILFALAITAPFPALAQTPNYEQASALLGASCGAEIDNFCRGVNLDPARLKECLRKNSDALSPKCQGDYPRAIGAIEQRVTARATLSKLCNWEMNHLCGEVRQDQVKGLQCLLEATKKVTPNCGKAISAAGYR